ncbi:MAG: YccF domain-containing protein [Chitinophagaceae bacterium]|nr:YccF domain-containing protein [Chitinophagaceae bacterium]
MNLPGNIIWLIFGGFFAALGYFFCGILLCITVVGIPWGLQCFKIGGLVLWPFGKDVVSSSQQTGCLSTLFNIIWLLSGGWYTALIHIVFGLLLAITVIGLPFARQHFKLIEISMMPFGKIIK